MGAKREKKHEGYRKNDLPEATSTMTTTTTQATLAATDCKPTELSNSAYGGLKATSAGSAASTIDTLGPTTLDTLPQMVVVDEGPEELHNAFDPAMEVHRSDPTRFKNVSFLQEAERNHGTVSLMWDTWENRYVAVKAMPNYWVKTCHTEFLECHPGNTELPWQDIGALKFLNSVNFPYTVQLLGVYQGDEQTEVVTTYANEGDFFVWANQPGNEAPGPKREAMVRPLAIQLLKAVQLLHQYSIVHRDISMENLLVSKHSEDAESRLWIMDFAMSTVQRYLECSEGRGKKSYQAPETHDRDGMCDGYLVDVFSIGVVMYCVLVNDYPWISTNSGNDKCFAYMQEYGFRSYVHKRKLRGSHASVASVLSDSAIDLLSGLLQPDPDKRLTLAEVEGWLDDDGLPRRTVWEEEWLTFPPDHSADTQEQEQD